MVSESWDVFTKRMLIEKHISGIMYENLEGHAPPPIASSADARTGR